MAAPPDPRDLPPPLPAMSPRDPRDRPPPLPRIKIPDGLLGACAGGFLLLAIILLSIIFTRGHTTDRERTPSPSAPVAPFSDPVIAEAYKMQQHYALDAVWNPRNWAGWTGKYRFSPPAETRIVRHGNVFRVRAWVKDSKEHCIEYTCEMRFDPELNTWQLLGKMNEIAPLQQPVDDP